jgi:hypothetical protein
VSLPWHSIVRAKGVWLKRALIQEIKPSSIPSLHDWCYGIGLVSRHVLTIASGGAFQGRQYASWLSEHS